MKKIINDSNLYSLISEGTSDISVGDPINLTLTVVLHNSDNTPCLTKIIAGLPFIIHFKIP